MGLETYTLAQESLTVAGTDIRTYIPTISKDEPNPFIAMFQEVKSLHVLMDMIKNTAVQGMSPGDLIPLTIAEKKPIVTQIGG